MRRPPVRRDARAHPGAPAPHDAAPPRKPGRIRGFASPCAPRSPNRPRKSGSAREISVRCFAIGTRGASRTKRSWKIRVTRRFWWTLGPRIFHQARIFRANSGSGSRGAGMARGARLRGRRAPAAALTSHTGCSAAWRARVLWVPWGHLSNPRRRWRADAGVRCARVRAPNDTLDSLLETPGSAESVACDAGRWRSATCTAWPRTNYGNLAEAGR